MPVLDYRLDDLTWDEFERLCQAILKASLGVGIEAWGGSGDWGNDAYCQAALRYPGSDLQQGPFQFQAKFVLGANAANAKPAPRLINAVAKECKRIQTRRQPRPQVYSLLTNAVASPSLRKSLERKIREVLPNCDFVVIHDGGDICTMLRLHPEVVREFPQLLSHRDIAEIVRKSIRESKKENLLPLQAQTEPSALLKQKVELARKATCERKLAPARELWNAVYERAIEERNHAVAIRARLETALILVKDGGKLADAADLADQCLRDARVHDIGRDRSRLLQIIGEIYRIHGKRDLARGFLTKALDHARSVHSPVDEGFALLSMSLLEERDREGQVASKSLDFINRAYDIFISFYSEGDVEDKKKAREGFAQCHSIRGVLYSFVNKDEALAEISQGLADYQLLGEGWELSVADTFLHRADLQSRIGQIKMAAGDLDEAARIYNEFGNTEGLASCYLQAGEIADLINRRTEALDHYEKAAAIASTWDNEPKASRFYFRYACKLMELRRYGDANRILEQLMHAPWLEREARLDVITVLCQIAKASDDDQQLDEMVSSAIALIDEMATNPVSAAHLPELLIKKGCLVLDTGQGEMALECFRSAIKRFEAIGDLAGVAECWFQIRGAMQKIGDQKGEREASERFLAIGSGSPMLIALTLIGLAQLNIKDSRYSEARVQLDKAYEIAPENPVVRMIAADLRSNLPKLSPISSDEKESSNRPPQRDFPNLLQELGNWCARYPARQKSILVVWYYIHRLEIWGILRSMSGVKFLISTPNSNVFHRIKMNLGGHGDFFVFGTSFNLKTRDLKSMADIDQIPVPDDFLFPAGVRIVTPSKSPALGRLRKTGRQTRSPISPRGEDLLRPVTGDLDEAYFLAFMAADDERLTKDGEGASDKQIKPYFIGRKQVWLDSKVINFMLENVGRTSVLVNSICLPLTESRREPSLKRGLQVASENRAILVFSEQLPTDSGVSSVCDDWIELPSPAGEKSAGAKYLWERLLSDCNGDSKLALTSFVRDMSALLVSETMPRIRSRVYLLQTLIEDRLVVCPTIVIFKPSANYLKTRK